MRPHLKLHSQHRVAAQFPDFRGIRIGTHRGHADPGAPSVIPLPSVESRKIVPHKNLPHYPGVGAVGMGHVDRHHPRLAPRVGAAATDVPGGGGPVVVLGVNNLSA